MPAAQPARDATDRSVSAPDATPHRALYRRFRSQRFAELIGQEPIVTTLRRAVAGDGLAHAYLFVGPRGTGKTSTARILAKAINCSALAEDGEPCDACPSCVAIREGRALDVIEIDAASHGLVDDARDLVMRALTAPSELRKRVYIIDEVHMLSTHAFNALLKLIEEPPDHVVFILATTDTHKVPATIISRTQRHDFRRLPEATIAGKLARICDAEGLEADGDALTLVARLADGGMRDAESLLDQVIAFTAGRLTEAEVRASVGLADEASIGELVDAYLAGDVGGALDRVAALADAGRDLAQVAAQAEGEARRRLLASAADPAAEARRRPAPAPGRAARGSCSSSSPSRGLQCHRRWRRGRWSRRHRSAPSSRLVRWRWRRPRPPTDRRPGSRRPTGRRRLRPPNRASRRLRSRPPPAPVTWRISGRDGRRWSSVPARSSSRCSRSAGRSRGTARA